VPEVEGSADDPAEGGVEGDREREEPVESTRAFRRPEVQSDGTGFPLRDGSGEDSADCGTGRRGERGVGMGAPGAVGAGGRTEGGGVGC